VAILNIFTIINNIENISSNALFMNRRILLIEMGSCRFDLVFSYSNNKRMFTFDHKIPQHINDFKEGAFMKEKKYRYSKKYYFW
jgi:hypothetical protein